MCGDRIRGQCHHLGCPPGAKGFGVLDAFPASGVLWKMCGKSPSKGDPLATAGAEIKVLVVEFWFKSSPGAFWGAVTHPPVARTFQRVL